MAVDALGNATFVWVSRLANDGAPPGVHVRRRSASGALGNIQTLSGSGTLSEPQIALDEAGKAVVAWRRSPAEGQPTALQVRSVAANGTLGATQTVAANAGDHDLAVASDGRAMLAWELAQTSSRLIMGRARAANGTLSATQTVSPVGATSSGPAVAIDPTGRTVFAWTRTTGTGVSVEGRARSATGALGIKYTLDAGTSAADLDVGVDSGGNAIHTWTSDSLGSDGILVRLRRRTASGVLGTKQTLSTLGINTSEPHAAIEANGAAVVVWTEHASGGIIRLRRRTAAGSLSAIQRLDQ